MYKCLQLSIHSTQPLQLCFALVKTTRFFVRQFECKFSIGEGKLVPERLEVKSEW